MPHGDYPPPHGYPRMPPPPRGRRDPRHSAFHGGKNFPTEDEPGPGKSFKFDGRRGAARRVKYGGDGTFEDTTVGKDGKSYQTDEYDRMFGDDEDDYGMPDYDSWDDRMRGHPPFGGFGEDDEFDNDAPPWWRKVMCLCVDVDASLVYAYILCCCLIWHLGKFCHSVLESRLLCIQSS